MARNDKKLEALSQVRLFSACNKKELSLIGKASDEITVPAGKTIVQEGDSGYEFFLILEGTAKVTKNARKVATLGPGQYFGEMSLLDGQLRSASVVAETDMRLLVLGRREFTSLIDEVPTIAHRLLAALAIRLREEDKKAISH